jgi:flagellar motor switch/type III secretory pathway protein FliN
MAWRPFALLPQAALDAVQDGVQAALARWCQDWGLAPDGFDLGCRRAWEAPAAALPAWRDVVAADGQALWLGWHDDWANNVQRMLFAPDRAHTPLAGTAQLAAEAAAEAVQQLGRALKDLLPAGGALPAGVTPDSALAHASGAVLAELRCGRLSLYCLLNHQAVQALAALARLRRGVPPPAAAPLPAVDLRRVLAAAPVSLPVALGRSELALGSLRTLAVGDVIRLDRTVDLPLQVQSPSGLPLMGGYLAACEGQLALELAPLKTQSGVKQ